LDAEKKQQIVKEKKDPRDLIGTERYDNLLELCKRYRTEHDKDLTPYEYILMLIDSAIDATYGSKGE
jgi:hypothetical protein